MYSQTNLFYTLLCIISYKTNKKKIFKKNTHDEFERKTYGVKLSP